MKRWPKPVDSDWVCFVGGGDVAGLVCYRCESIVRICLPISLNDMPELMRAYSRLHRRCRRNQRSERRDLLLALRRRAKLPTLFQFGLAERFP